MVQWLGLSPGSILGWGTKILQAVENDRKKKRKKKRKEKKERKKERKTHKYVKLPGLPGMVLADGANYVYFFFGGGHAEQHVGSDQCPLHWKHAPLTTGLPGKSLCLHFSIPGFLSDNKALFTLLL